MPCDTLNGGSRQSLSVIGQPAPPPDAHAATAREKGSDPLLFLVAADPDQRPVDQEDHGDGGER